MQSFDNLVSLQSTYPPHLAPPTAVGPPVQVVSILMRRDITSSEMSGTRRPAPVSYPIMVCL